MANHGLRRPRGSGSVYLDLPGPLSERAREHFEALTGAKPGERPEASQQDESFDPRMHFDHATAAQDLQDIDAPAYLVKYHQDMADQGPANQNSASLADRADQTKHILEEE